MMTRLLSFVSSVVLSRGGSAAFGVLALVSLVWFLGPRLGLSSVSARLMVIGGLVGLVLLYLLVRTWIARRRGAKLGRELSAGDDPHALEIEALQEKMKSAIGALKSSDLGIRHRGSAALYALPWFMIIGPSAAGKSTLLRNSGLHFPYHAEHGDQHVQGFGGTRNCDWWFSDEAVILDTAGRYTTESEDHPEWMAFLGMLRKFRSRRPVNGVIVAVSVPEILTADEAGLERHVKIVRERISELINTLKIVFPVYLVFTKADLVKGFDTYFEDLSSHEREQVWGFFLDPQDRENNLSSQFERHMGEFEDRLESQRFHKIALQRRLDRKARVFDFPNQVTAARERLQDFVTLLFKPNPYQEMPEFSGVYFTSGTQEGRPLERVIGSLSDAFGYEEAPSETESRAYFIKDLFSRVIFPNREAVARTRKRLWGHRIAKGVAASLGIALVTITGLALVGSYTLNVMLMNDGERILGRLDQLVQQGDPDPEAMGAALMDAQAQYERLQEYEKELPWQLRGGTYRADRQIEPLEQAIVHATYRTLYPEAAQMVEGRLEQMAGRWRQAATEQRDRLQPRYYRALKHYLMVTDPGRADMDVLREVMRKAWEQRGFVSMTESTADGKAAPEIPADTPRVQALLDLFLQDFEPGDAQGAPDFSFERDRGLVLIARGDLSRDPTPGVLYARLKRGGEQEFDTVSLASIIGRRGAYLMESEAAVHGMYTREAWRNHLVPQMDRLIEQATKTDWVIDGEVTGEGDRQISEELAQNLEKRIQSLYFADYRDEWERFLSGLSVKQPSSIAAAGENLLLLSDRDGPLVALGEWIETNLDVRARSEAAAVSSNDLLAQAAETSEDETDAAVATGKRVLGGELEAVRQLFAPADDEAPVSESLSAHLDRLGAVQAELQGLASASDPARDARMYAAALLSGRGSDKAIYQGWGAIPSVFAGLDPGAKRMLSPLFESMITGAWRVVIARAAEDIDRQWRNVVGREFQRRLAGRFPFDPDGEDASLRDVADFLHPREGLIWQFVENDLAAFIQETRGRWRARHWIGVGPAFTSEFLGGLRRAGDVSSTLFSRGNLNPSMTFHLYPVPTEDLSEVEFATNGQAYRYRNEPEEWRRFDWPGDAGDMGAHVSAVGGAGDQGARIETDGPWALFRLLSRADVEQTSGDVYALEWSVDDGMGGTYPVRFRLRADRSDNFIEEGLFAGFRLPSSPFPRAYLARSR